MNTTASSMHAPKVIIHRLYTPAEPRRAPRPLWRAACLLSAVAALQAREGRLLRYPLNLRLIRGLPLLAWRLGSFP
jgi:hypothetical protein